MGKYNSIRVVDLTVTQLLQPFAVLLAVWKWRAFPHFGPRAGSPQYEVHVIKGRSTYGALHARASADLLSVRDRPAHLRRRLHSCAPHSRHFEGQQIG